MYPHERSLVDTLRNEPFTILGVNSDPPEVYRTAVEANGITWPSFFDGGTTGGPIATRWGIHLWPTVFILDHEGVIRAVGHGVDDDLVHELVAAAKRN